LSPRQCRRARYDVRWDVSNGLVLARCREDGHVERKLGVIDGHGSGESDRREDENELEQRIKDAAATIGQGDGGRTAQSALQQICISPQCGFASHSEGNRITREDVEKKLKLVSCVAQKVWG